MKDARSNLVNQVAEEIQKYFKEKVYSTFIHDHQKQINSSSVEKSNCYIVTWENTAQE